MLFQARFYQENGDPVSQESKICNKIESEELTLRLHSGTGVDERRRCSRLLCRTIDDRCSNQGEPAHRLAQFLREFILFTTFSCRMLTILAVDSNGTLGGNCNRPILWLPAPEETYPLGSFVSLAKAWSSWHSWMRTSYCWVDITTYRTQFGWQHFWMEQCTSSGNPRRWHCHPPRFRCLRMEVYEDWNLASWSLPWWKESWTDICALSWSHFHRRNYSLRLCDILPCLVSLTFLVIHFLPFPINTGSRTTSLFETDPFLEVARAQPAWICGGLSTVVYGFASTKLKSIRAPLIVGFLILTSGLVGLATIQPNNSASAIVFSGLVGLGFGAPLALIIAGVQLSTPYNLIATATALTTSSRSVAAAVFTAIYSATVSDRLAKYIPSYVAEAAVRAGLPLSSVPAFVGALASNNATALPKIPGVSPLIIDAGVNALKQAFADGIRAVFMIAAPFGALACIACFFLGDMKATMNYHVDAPMEDLHAKHNHRENAWYVKEFTLVLAREGISFIPARLVRLCLTMVYLKFLNLCCCSMTMKLESAK